MTTRVLIVEEDERACGAVQAFLNDVGYDARCAADPAAARAALPDAAPHVLVLDVRTAETRLAAERFLASLRDDRPAGSPPPPPLPVILATPDVDPVVLRRWRDLGVRRVFEAARFTLTALAEVIEDLLAEPPPVPAPADSPPAADPAAPPPAGPFAASHDPRPTFA